MKLPIAMRYIFSSTLVAVLSGCSAGGSQSAFPGSQSAPLQSASRQVSGLTTAASNASSGYMQAAASKQELIYMSSWGTLSAVDVFTAAGQQVGQIINGLQNLTPEGLTVGSKGSLWVASGGPNGEILVYPRGALSPIKVLTDSIGPPVDVAVCPDGTAYAANGYNVSNSNSSSVQIYAHDSLTPTGTLSYAKDFRNQYVTCDAKGNVFVAITTALNVGNGRVIEFPGGKQAGVVDLGISLQYPGGIVPDKAGNLLVTDYYATTITEYTEAGAPTGKSFNTTTNINGIALSADNKTVIGAAPGLYEGIAWSFPSGKQGTVFSCCSRISPPLQVNSGVAIAPAQKGV